MKCARERKAGGAAAEPLGLPRLAVKSRSDSVPLCFSIFVVCVEQEATWILLALVLVVVISYCQESERLTLAFAHCLVVQLCPPGCPVLRSSRALTALQRLTEQVWGGV